MFLQNLQQYIQDHCRNYIIPKIQGLIEHAFITEMANRWDLFKTFVTIILKYVRTMVDFPFDFAFSK